MTTRSVLYTILSVPLLLLLGCRDDGLGLPTDASPRVPPVPLAQAEPEPGIVPDLTGTWNGLLGLPAAIVPMQPDEDEEELSFSELDIVDQRDRRVFGTKTMGGTTFDLDGTVSGAGIVSIVFKGVGTSPGTAEGLYHLETFGGEEEDGAALLLGDVLFGGGAGPSIAGPQLLLRSFGGDPPDAPLAGTWEGAFLSGIDGEARDVVQAIEQAAGSTRLTGSLSLIGTNNVVEGSINAAGDVVLVGMGVGTVPGIILVLVLEGQHTQAADGEPATIEGVYRIFEAVAPNSLTAIAPNSLFEAIGMNSLIDFGTFEFETIPIVL
jgi:hypothetical protein